MEHLKDILIMTACTIFVVYIFFSANYNGGEGVFENVGNVYAPMMKNDPLKWDAFNYMEEKFGSFESEIKYISGAKQVGDCIKFTDMFEVKAEEEYTLYLVDIKRTGNSVLEYMSSDAVENMEEISASFIYDKERELLYFFESGVYTVEIKIYGSSGAIENYEFKLPVESV